MAELTGPLICATVVTRGSRAQTALEDLSMEHTADLATQLPKSPDFSLSPTAEELKAELLPAVAESGADLEYTGVVQVGAGSVHN